MSLTLTPEQQDFVSAVRDFAKRECGTREQRDSFCMANHEFGPAAANR